MEPNAFETLYRTHFRSVYRVCYAYLKNPADAEDCTEDTFVRAMDARISFENDRHAHAWLTVTAINLCKDRLKHWWHRSVVSLEGYEESACVPDAEPDPVLDAVMALPPKYKDVICLYYYDGYQTDEIARMLKRPPSTVRNQLRDARSKLKTMLGGTLP